MNRPTKDRLSDVLFLVFISTMGLILTLVLVSLLNGCQNIPVRDGYPYKGDHLYDPTTSNRIYNGID